MGLAGNTCEIVLGKSDGKQQPEKCRGRWGDIIKIEIFCKVTYCT
jgi:hypothetical protein